MLKPLSKLGLALGLFSLSLAADANIIITGTRVIYDAHQKAVSVQLTNESELPALMQAWIDDGDLHSSPTDLSATRVPFIIVPPVSRMEPHAGQTLRINYTARTPLPQDRESIFYLNVLDIPPKPKANQSNNNYLQIALRSRIKLFYRPSLNIAPEQAYLKVQWRAEGAKLKIHNPTPYFITYSAVKIDNKAIKHVGMLAPFSDKTLDAKVRKGQRVNWSVINDFGADSTGQASIQ